jgi:phosphatidylinositol-3-phosphatase
LASAKLAFLSKNAQYRAHIGKSGKNLKMMSLLPRFRRPLGIGWALALWLLAPLAAAADTPPPIRHVFLIVLENEGFDRIFGPKSESPYLGKVLARRGALLSQYFGTGHNSLDNYLAMISGQAATPETRDDCRGFADFVATGIAPDGQAIGHGCVYPPNIKTLADQLDDAGLSWRGYMEDMGNDPARGVERSCGHPAIGTPDLTQKAKPNDQYAARHDPFVYFHSVIDRPACARSVLRLEQLPIDLKRTETTPAFSFITPNLCHDGHDEPCADHRHGGLREADAFLKHWVPLILAARGFKQDGLLIITFDESDAASIKKKPGGGRVVTFTGESCCKQMPGPNLAPFPQTKTFHGVDYVMQNFGGDRIGAVLLSPFIKKGTVSKTPYNHYSLLKSLEDLFHLDAHLGYAGQQGLAGFGQDVFTAAPSP